VGTRQHALLGDSMTAMPVICRWGSVKILLWSREDDRHSPHFHVKCVATSASIDIETGKVYASTLSGNDLRAVLSWAETHRDELMAAWNEIQAGRSPGQIAP
jgi:hypothetical protein